MRLLRHHDVSRHFTGFERGYKVFKRLVWEGFERVNQSGPAEFLRYLKGALETFIVTGRLHGVSGSFYNHQGVSRNLIHKGLMELRGDFRRVSIKILKIIPKDPRIPSILSKALDFFRELSWNILKPPWYPLKLHDPHLNLLGCLEAFSVGIIWNINTVLWKL